MKGCDPASWLIALKKKNWECEPSSYEDALETQKKVTEVAKGVWGKVIGYKVALTSPESQKTFGGGPITGPLFSLNVLGNGSTVYLNELSDPLLEAEIFLCDEKFYLAFEVPDNRYGKKWNELNWLQLLADLAGSYKVVVGDGIDQLKGRAELLGPDGNVIASRDVDEAKIFQNMKILEGQEGCKLLGTVLQPYKVKEAGTYIFKLGDSEVKIALV